MPEMMSIVRCVCSSCLTLLASLDSVGGGHGSARVVSRRRVLFSFYWSKYPKRLFVRIGTYQPGFTYRLREIEWTSRQNIYTYYIYILVVYILKKCPCELKVGGSNPRRCFCVIFTFFLWRHEFCHQHIKVCTGYSTNDDGHVCAIKKSVLNTQSAGAAAGAVTLCVTTLI